MSQRLKRWESPRKEGRNDKGKGGSARQRQLKKRTQMLRQKLKDQGNDNNSQGQNKKGEGIIIPLPFFMSYKLLSLQSSNADLRYELLLPAPSSPLPAPHSPLLSLAVRNLIQHSLRSIADRNFLNCLPNESFEKFISLVELKLFLDGFCHATIAPRSILPEVFDKTVPRNAS